MREWKSYCHNYNYSEEVEYSYHAEVDGADVSIMPLGDNEWMIVIQVDEVHTKERAQRLSEKLLSVIEASD